MENVWKIMEGWRKYNQDAYSVGTDPFYGPPPLINDVIDCWAKEGVRFFSQFHNINGFSYHTTLPTDELEFHIERDMSRHDHGYMAQQLIQDGHPPRAVQISVGKNGRAIIDRDSEIVMAAKHVGLAELPVLFNFMEEV